MQAAIKQLVSLAKVIYRLIRPRTPEQRKSILKNIYGACLFGRFDWVRRPFWIAWHPDSSYEKHSHPELDTLYKSWVRGNRSNNCGDLSRLYSFILNIKQLISEKVDGVFAELGVWRGNSAAVLAYFAQQSNRRMFCFDTFSGFDACDLRGVDAEHSVAFADTSLGYVQEIVGKNKSVIYLKGHFPDAISDDASHSQYAFVSIDCDLYEPMKAGLRFFYPRMPKGGTLFLHDYSSGLWGGVTQAIDEFCEETSELLVLLPDKSGTAVIRKSKV